MQLGNSRFIDAKNGADFLHRYFLEVVEGKDQALLFRKDIDSFGKQLCQFGRLELNVKIVAAVVRIVVDDGLGVILLEGVIE